MLSCAVSFIIDSPLRYQRDLWQRTPNSLNDSELWVLSAQKRCEGNVWGVGCTECGETVQAKIRTAVTAKFCVNCKKYCSRVKQKVIINASVRKICGINIYLKTFDFLTFSMNCNKYALHHSNFHFNKLLH